METYAKLVIKNQKEWNIERVNQELQALGYPSRTFNKGLYGAFITRKKLKEDARLMNLDPESSRQLVHMNRPITPELLEQFFWNKLGTFVVKISCFDKAEKERWEIVFNYALNHKEDFDWAASENCSRENLRSCGFKIKGG